MKRSRIPQFFYTFLFTCVAWIGCTSGGQQGSEVASSESLGFVLTNATSADRVDEGIALTRAALEALTTAIPAGKVPMLKDAAGNDIVSQTDDLDGDGSWDELALVASIPANTTLNVAVSFVDPSELPAYTPRTSIRMAKKPEGSEDYVELSHETRPSNHTKAKPTVRYQMEGPAWESDLVAFRLYFDPRNGKDIFGKVAKETVLDSVGITGNYHKMQSWGMDILKVGNSLGAGALAMQVDGQLHRLTGCEPVTFEILNEGPVRSTLRLHYTGWPVAGKSYDLTEDITIWAGRLCYESTVTVTGLEEEQALVTGIVNLHSEEVAFTEHNAGFVSIATHDNQAFDGEKLGMAVMVPTSTFLEKGTTPEADEGEGITETFYTTMRLQNAKPVTFSFYAGWEKQDAGFANKAYFLEVLQKDAERRNAPIIPQKAQPAS